MIKIKNSRSLGSSRRLKIMHCVDASDIESTYAVAGLIQEQAKLGYDVGLIYSPSARNAHFDANLKNLHALCSLGLFAISMTSRLGLNSVSALRTIRKTLEQKAPRIVHSHGIQAGTYARLACAKINRKAKTIATFHTSNGKKASRFINSFSGHFKAAAERRFAFMTDGIIFESAQSASLFQTQVGDIPCPSRIIHHGLADYDAYAFAEEGHNAYQKQSYHQEGHIADFVFIGDLVRENAVEIFLQALSGITVQTPVTAAIVGDGPERKALQRHVRKLKFGPHVAFLKPRPIEEAMTKGRCLVYAPTKQDGFPFILLEAGMTALPSITTNAGVIPEIIQNTHKHIIPANDVLALRNRMEAFLIDPTPFEVEADHFAEHLYNTFSAQRMTDAVMEFYYTAV